MKKIILLLLIIPYEVTGQVENEPDSSFIKKMEATLVDFSNELYIVDTIKFIDRCIEYYQFQYETISLKKNKFVKADSLLSYCELSAVSMGRYACCSQRSKGYLILAYIFKILNRTPYCKDFYLMYKSFEYRGDAAIKGERELIDKGFEAYKKAINKSRKYPRKIRYILNKELKKTKLIWHFE